MPPLSESRQPTSSFCAALLAQYYSLTGNSTLSKYNGTAAALRKELAIVQAQVRTRAAVCLSPCDGTACVVRSAAQRDVTLRSA